MSSAVIQQVQHSRLIALSVSDGLARALRTAGDFPPLLGEIACDVIKQFAPTARTFDPPLVLRSFRNASGFLIIDGTFSREDADGRAFPLGDGTYLLRVTGDYYQPAELLITWPPPVGQVRVPPAPAGHRELLPSGSYPLPDVTASRYQLGPTVIRGTLMTSSGDPIEGGTVEIINLPPFLNVPPPLTLAQWPFIRATTSASGDWALVLPNRRYLDNTPEIPPNANPLTKTFDLRVTQPDGTTIVLQRSIPFGREYTLKLTGLRGQVSTIAGRPIANAQVATSVSGLTTTTRANGLWFLYFPFDQLTVNNVTVTVTTPSGASASTNTAHLEPDATTVVPTFHFA